MKARVLLVIAAALVGSGAALLQKHPTSRGEQKVSQAPVPELEPLWPDVVVSIDDWLEGGPRRTGITLVLLGVLTGLGGMGMCFRREA